VHAAIGVAPVIYTPFDLDQDFGCMLWVARYSNANAVPHIPKPWTRYRMRQFSDGRFGTPNQVGGMHCDLNTLHDGEDLAHLQIPVRPEPKPPVKTPAKPPSVAKPAPAPAPTPAPKPAPAPAKPRTMRVVSWNVERDRNPGVVRGEVEGLIAQTKADVVCLQEANDYAAVLRQVPGFTTIAFHAAPEQDGTTILIRNGIGHHPGHAVKTTSAGWTTVRGGKTPPMWATVCLIEDVEFWAVHTPPSQQPTAKRKVMRARARAYDEVMRSLKPGPHAVVAGDWNVTPDATAVATFPKPRFHELGLQLVAPRSGTKGNRAIDYFGVKGVRAGACTVVAGKRGSDHRPVQFTITKETR
jgi:endonuclease/exonuclease/phosphatase family metal-dependent hydrolase